MAVMARQPKVMISQPMNGKTELEIRDKRDKLRKALEAKGYAVMDTYFADDWADPATMLRRGVEHIPLAFMARCLETMSMCDAVFFSHGWEQARGCRIEHEAAKAYGLEIIYE